MELYPGYMETIDIEKEINKLKNELQAASATFIYDPVTVNEINNKIFELEEKLKYNKDINKN